MTEPSKETKDAQELASTSLFSVYYKPEGRIFGEDGFWEDRFSRQHLDEHLMVSPSGRVFWKQYDGLKEITDQCEVRLNPENTELTCGGGSTGDNANGN